MLTFKSVMPLRGGAMSHDTVLQHIYCQVYQLDFC